MVERQTTTGPIFEAIPVNALTNPNAENTKTLDLLSNVVRIEASCSQDCSPLDCLLFVDVQPISSPVLAGKDKELMGHLIMAGCPRNEEYCVKKSELAVDIAYSELTGKKRERARGTFQNMATRLTALTTRLSSLI